MTSLIRGFMKVKLIEKAGVTIVMESPCKRFRTEEKSKELDEWEDEDCFTNNMEQIDALMSQAFSQVSAVTATNNNAVVLVDSFSNFIETTTTANRTWTSSSVVGHPSTSVQQYEKQNQQMMNVHLGIKSTEEQLKSMSVSLAKNEQDLEVSRAEKIKLQEKVTALEQERNLANKQLEKLRKELDFMAHEATRRQWSSSPMRIATVAVKEQQKSSPKKQSLSLKRKNDPLNAFPTMESFTQRTNVVKSPIKVSTTREQEIIDDKGDFKINYNQCVKKLTLESVETGPGLVSLLLRETARDLFQSNTNPLAEWTKKPNFSLGSREFEMESIALSRPGPNESPKKSALIASNSSADLLSALIEMIQVGKDDGELESRLKWIPSDMPLLLTRIGLCKDRAHILLPAIEEILGVLPLSTPISATTNNNNAQGSSSSCPLLGHVLSLDIDSVYSGTTITSFQSLSSEARIQASMSLVTNALKLLRMIAYYSPKVRYCIITETLVDSVECDVRDVVVHNEPTFECGSVDLNGASTLDSERVENATKCLILNKLIKFCCQDTQRDDTDAPLFVIILDIFTAVSSYSSVLYLSRFNPLISSLPMEKFTNLTLDGTVFVQLLAFLVAISASSTVAENFCNQDEFCLWILMCNTWQKARKTLPLNIIEKIDLQMIILLTTCITREKARPSFLSSNDCHCPFNIATSVILYLHGQKTLHEQQDSLPSLNAMSKGIALLYLLTQTDKNFTEHCSNVDAEFFTFLYWLPRVHKQWNLGDESTALMDMWNILAIDE